MPTELSEKDKKLKTMMEESLANPDGTWPGRFRRVNSLLPKDPRCTLCMKPFVQKDDRFFTSFYKKRRSMSNPLFCTTCEDMAKKLHAGVETELTMLFADIRGSTPLAESMSPTQFRQLIDRFYTETTHVLTHSLAMIDKLAGDEVSGFYLPGYVGKDHARVAVDAARGLLEVTGHADAEGPWVPVGAGVNTGVAYFGTVGTSEDLIEITALGDEVNVAARLASQAAAGEILLSQTTVDQAGLDTAGLQKRTLDLKGKAEPIDVWVMAVGPA
jgi:adenylate cyclase